MLQPTLYFPCLAPIEQEAIRLVYSLHIPTYFVIPAQPIVDYFMSVGDDGAWRLANFENMFQVTKSEETIPPFDFPILVYSGFYEYYLTWIIYDPIAYGTTPPACRMYEYSQV
jgi:hypothetical protein